MSETKEQLIRRHKAEELALKKNCGHKNIDFDTGRFIIFLCNDCGAYLKFKIGELKGTTLKEISELIGNIENYNY